MSLQDKVEIVKNVLTIILKVCDVLLNAVNTVLDKIGGNN